VTPLQITRYDRLVRRLMNLVGEGAIVTGVLEDVFPIFDVENLQPDGFRWAGWDLAVGADTITSVGVGDTSRTFLDNPPGSGVVGILTKLYVFSTDSPSNYRGSLVPLAAARAATGEAGFRDTRAPTTGLPVLTLFSEENAVATPGLETMRFNIGGGENLPGINVDDGIAVLGPGTSLLLRQLNDVANMQTTWFWRERRLEPAEFT